MSSVKDLFHRNKTRIKIFGEVFTLDTHVKQMIEQLSLYGKGNEDIWSDEKISFFEPTCGHGNIVEGIFEKRLNSFYLKAKKNKTPSPEHYSVANALNTLWAIDIDDANIRYCRSRIITIILNFMKANCGYKTKNDCLRKNRDFFAHILCAIQKHISVNEALSALSDEESAHKNAALTKTGAEWIKLRKHNSIDFSLSWVSYFKECKKNKITPIEFIHAEDTIKNLLKNRKSKFKAHAFYEDVFLSDKLDSTQLMVV